MQLTVTTLAAGIMGLWFLILTLRTIGARRTGDKTEQDKTRLERRVRGHGNFAEFTPMILVLIGLAEYGGIHNVIIWVSAGLLVIGRLLHGYAFSFTDHHPLGRGGGTALTILSLLVISAANLWLVAMG